MRGLWFLGFVSACTLPLEGASCPCSIGWICCNDQDVCVRDGEMCPAAGGGNGCVPGESCPGDPPPGPPVGTINMGLARFPDGTILPDRDLVVTFPIVVAALDRNATFGVAASASLSAPLPITVGVTILDENEREISSIVLPKTDAQPHTRTLKVKLSLPALPAGMSEAAAHVVLGLSTPLSQLRPSSGQVEFTVGKPAPLPNDFSIDLTSINSIGSEAFVDSQYAIVHLGPADMYLMFFRADLSAAAAGETFTVEVATTANPAWPLSPCLGSGVCGSTVTLTTPASIPLELVLFDPMTADPTQLDLTLRGPSQVSTTHFTMTRR